MGNTIYPEYRPPVNSSRVRQLWAKGVGINGALSGFAIREEPDEFGGTSTILSKGSIISDSCVVETDEMLLNTLTSLHDPLFVYGSFDARTGDAFVEMSSEPKSHWVLIAVKWNGEWSVPGDDTAYSLWVGANEHSGSSDMHISQDEYDALSAEPEATPLNVFLKKSDKDTGMVYSPSDLCMYPMGTGGSNESGIVIDGYSGNLMSGCSGSYAPGGGSNGVLGNVESSLFTIEANGRWFDDTFNYYSFGSYSIQNAASESIDKPSPVSQLYYSVSISEGEFEAIAAITNIEDQSGEPIFGSKVLSIMFFAEDQVDHLRLVVGMTSGDNKETLITNPETGKWKCITANVTPEESESINSMYLAIKGQTGATVRITQPRSSPVVTFIADFGLSPSENSTSFRISPLAGVASEHGDHKYFIESTGRDTFEIKPFVNHAPSSASPEDLMFKVKAVMSNSGGLVSTIGPDWLTARKDYCITNSENTGASFVMGGRASVGLADSVEAYSPSCGIVSNIGNANSSIVEKAASADFKGAVVISGGLRGGVQDASLTTVSFSPVTMSSMSRADMIEARSEHGSCAIDNETAMVWGGLDERTIRSYNIVSDTWTSMSEIMNIRGVRGGSYFEGAKAHDRVRYSSDDIANDIADPDYSSSGCIVLGVGSLSGSTGGKIDMATFSFINLGVDNMVLGSNIATQKYGVAIYQSESPNDARTGCMDIFSGVERKIEIPTTGRGSSGNSLHRDGSISYGPFSGVGGYSSTHNIYTYMTPCWLNGLALKWEDDNS